MSSLDKYISGVSNAFYEQNQDIDDASGVQYSMLSLIKQHGDALFTSNKYSKHLQENQLNTYYDNNRFLTEYKKNANQRNIEHNMKRENDQRQNEIYRYYYFKYKIQLKILYVFLAYVVFLMICTFLRNVMGDMIYSILFGISSACFVIFAGLNLYDIYLRSDIIFHEYDADWRPSALLNINKKKQDQHDLNLQQKCEKEYHNLNIS